MGPHAFFSKNVNKLRKALAIALSSGLCMVDDCFARPLDKCEPYLIPNTVSAFFKTVNRKVSNR